MAQLKADGVTIVYISHKLDEVERITDEVIVMRDGRFVARERHRRRSTRHQMANLMVGRELVGPVPAARTPPPAATPPLLQVRGLTRAGLGRGRQLRGAAGEILGFAGLVGAGRTELFEGLLGLRPHSAERIELGGPRGAHRAARARRPTRASPT